MFVKYLAAECRFSRTLLKKKPKTDLGLKRSVPLFLFKKAGFGGDGKRVSEGTESLP